MKKIFVGLITIFLMCFTLSGNASPDIPSVPDESGIYSIDVKTVTVDVGSIIVANISAVERTEIAVAIPIIKIENAEYIIGEIENEKLIAVVYSPNIYWNDLMELSHWRTDKYIYIN